MKAFLERWLEPTEEAHNQAGEMQEGKTADSLSGNSPIADGSETKPYSVQVLDAEIMWRVEVFLQQIPGHGPIPFLVAREAVESSPNCCPSCGEALINSPGYVCGPCSRAKDRALEIAMRYACDARYNHIEEVLTNGDESRH